MTQNENELIELAKRVESSLARQDLDKADEIANQLVEKNRSAGLAYRGVVALRRNQYSNAEEFLLESFQLNGKQNLALANLLPVYLKKKDFKKAVAFGEQAYSVMKENQSVCINYAAALIQEQLFQRAVDVLEPQYNEKNPSLPVLSALIATYRSMFRTEEAHKLMKIAETNFGESKEIARLRADILTEVDPKGAYEGFQKVLLQEPESIPVRWNMSLIELRLGKFETGWVNYDCGLLPEVGKIGRPLPKLFEGAKRIVDFDDIGVKKWTFAVCEQGIGDQVLFLGVLKQFLKDYPKTALISDKRMAPILARSFPNIPIYLYGAGPLLAANRGLANGYMPIGSMQKKYRKSKEAFENGKGIYLTPDEKKVKQYRDILLKKTGAKKIIGFSWKGGYWERAQKTKTLDIDLWSPIFENDEVIFVSLQYGDVSKEKEYLLAKYKNIRWIDGIDFKKDLDSWFSLICACDDIISVSTALVHFAGAAGKSVHLLLSDRGAPFIWGLEDTNSIAYKDVKIYRKKTNQSNDEFFQDVSKKAVSVS